MASVPSFEPLSGLDAAFLALDNPTTPLHMGAVGVFSGDVDVDRLTTLLARRATGVERLRLRARSTWFPPGGAAWRPDPRFDATDHVHVRRLEAPQRPDALERCVAEWIAAPLPAGRALWSIDVVPGLPGGKFAMLLKLHHALTDGTGAVEVAAGLLDPLPPRAAQARAGEPPASSPSLVRAVEGGIRTAAHTAELGLGLAKAVRPGYRSPLGARSSRSKRVSFIRLDATDLRAIRKAHGGTPNDVVLAVIAGALRTWLQARDVPVEGMTLRALVPVSLRGRHVPQSGGNRLSGYLCPLPIGVDDPTERLRLVRDAMNENKKTGPLKGPGALPLLADRVPVAIHRLATGMIAGAGSSLFDLVVTNVGLPRVPLTLAGATMHSSFPLVPIAPGQTLGIGVSPYRDSINVTLHADADAITDLDVLTTAVQKQTTALHELCA